MSKRIPAEDLLAYAAGELPPDQAAEVETRLQDDPEAAALLRGVEFISKCLAPDGAVEPPPQVRARAKAIFLTKPAERLPGWLDRLGVTIARLIYDARLQPAGFRYADSGRRVQLTYEAKGLEIDVQAERVDVAGPPGDRRCWHLIGQIEPASCGGDLPVALLAAKTTSLVAETKTDDRAVFTLEAPAGRFDLVLGLPGGPILLPGVELGCT